MYDYVKKISGSWWSSLVVEDLKIVENIKKECSTISCQIKLTKLPSHTAQIIGTGQGPVDALYKSVFANLSPSFPSLKNIKFKDFSVKTNEIIGSPGSDSQVEAKLVVTNSYDKEFEFVKKSSSMISASVGVVSKAIEMFVNAEICILRTRQLLMDANSRHRPDLVEEYTGIMSELVKITNYVEALKNEN